MDDVVAQIDRSAYEMSTSRSNLVNQILADYVSYVTPEKRMRAVFACIERMLVSESVFQPLLQPSEYMYSLRSALSYKYNPSVRYSIELYREQNPFPGVLRVSLRSQNSSLTLAMLQFFKLWVRMEQSMIGVIEYVIEDARFTRKLLPPRGREMDNEVLGEAIAQYISLFDQALKTYFSYLHNPIAAARGVECLYADHLRRAGVLIL